MKVFVVHDTDGNIHSFGIPSPELAGLIGLQAPPGQYATEVEVPEIQSLREGSEQELERVMNLLQQSRLDATGSKPRLIKK